MDSKEKEPSVPWLDGLRGLAILLVLTDHFFHENYILKGGWIGVNLFFILSGYLITGKLFDHAEQDGGRYYFRNFYGRRILRIFPIYYGCLIIFFGVLPLVYGRYFHFFDELYKEQWWYWSYLSNWRIVFYGSPANVVLVPFWSLAVEEQFYLIWPFVFLYAERINRKMVILFLLGISIVCRISVGKPEFSYFSTLTAAEPLLMGAWLAILKREGRLLLYRRVVAVVCIPAIVILSVIVSRSHDFTNTNSEIMCWGYTCIDILLAGILYWLAAAGEGRTWMRRVFSSGWLRWFGKYSYGIYIYHMFILLLLVFKVQAIMTDGGMGTESAYLLSRAGGIIFLLVCSYGSYHFFEKRFLRLKRYFS